MKNMKPLVSVIMPAKNAGDFLRASVASILDQTYKNIELIVVDDASNDDTAKILNFFKTEDRRVKIIRNKISLGVSKAASIGILGAKGEYIARMDADDVALPERIERQVEFLQENKSVVAVGGQCELINKEGEKIGYKRFPQDDTQIRKMIFMNVPLQQPTLMVKKRLLPKGFVWYDENYSSAEELELIFKLFKFGKVVNLPSVLLKYRLHDHNTSLINPKKTFYLTLKTRLIAVLRYGYVPSVRGILVSLLQALFVLLMPEKTIYPAYLYLRGIKKIDLGNAKINLDANLLLQKAYGLVKA